MSVSLWAVPTNSFLLQKRFKTTITPHIVLERNVTHFKEHKAYPKRMHFSVKHKEMIVRQVGFGYEYGWILNHNENPAFMVCHETTSESENVIHNGVLLNQETLDADVIYSLGGVLVEPEDMEHIMNRI